MVSVFGKSASPRWWRSYQNNGIFLLLIPDGIALEITHAGFVRCCIFGATAHNIAPRPIGLVSMLLLALTIMFQLSLFNGILNGTLFSFHS